MPRYRNTLSGFEVDLPEGWSEYGFFKRLFRTYDPAQPELAGPNGADLKFAVGPIAREPGLEEMQRNLDAIARRHGHWVVDVGSISVAGTEHATIMYHVPLGPFRPVTEGYASQLGLQTGPTLRAKNYHIVLNGVEYVMTGKIALFDGPIRDIGGEPVQELSELYAYDDDYDDIARTFRLI